MKKIIEKILWKALCIVADRTGAVKGRFGDEVFRKKSMDPSFEWQQYTDKYIPYFQKYGFNVSRVECEYFSKASGIISDYYITFTLWQYFIYPYLNRAEWRYAYTDKNMFERILDINRVQKEIDVNIPETIISNMNGILFVNGKISDFEDAVDAVVNHYSDMIIKPTVETCQGHGVAKIEYEGIARKNIVELLKNYRVNYVVQNAVVQHPDLKAFNETSVNTIRLTTYRDFHGKIKVIQVLQRFGGKGSIFDNASAGGTFCAIHSDGTYDRTVHKFHTLKTSRLDDSLPQRVPYFEKIVSVCEYMHNQLPMFDIVAWDMTVTPEGHPYIIEYNICPAPELQMATGPLFPKEDLDEIMQRIQNYQITNEFKAIVSFPEKPGYYYRR